MYKTILIIVGILAIIVSIIKITKFFLELNVGKKKQLQEDYNSVLLALENTSEKDEHYKHLKDLAEIRKYQLLVGLPFVSKRCAQYLLAKVDKSNVIYRYRRCVALVDFSEVDNRFKYAFGFQTSWIRKLKQWVAFCLYILFASLAFFPILFWNRLDPDDVLYQNYVSKNSLESLWIIALMWMGFLLTTSFIFINYASQVHFAEKLVGEKKDFKFFEGCIRYLFRVKSKKKSSSY